MPNWPYNSLLKFVYFLSNLNWFFKLQLLQCIHGLWYPPLAYSLSEVLKKAKCLDPCSQFEHTDKLLWIDNGEGSQEKDTRQLIEGIRESG